MTHLGYTEEQLAHVYRPDYGTNFKELIFGLLKRAKISRSAWEEIYGDGTLWIQAFTHISVEENDNYENLEMAGDSLVYSTIIQYLRGRLPQCSNPAGVRILTRLKINLVSKEFLAMLAEHELGFWPFIAATGEFRLTRKRPMCEDVFEAVLQVLYTKANLHRAKKQRGKSPNSKVRRSGSGFGFEVVENLMHSLLDTIPICGGFPSVLNTDEESLYYGWKQQPGALDYATLVDAKTRLKEFGDANRQTLGKLVYENIRDEGSPVCNVKIYFQSPLNSRKKFLGSGTAALQADAQQAAATVALEKLRSQGMRKSMPPHYAKFCPPTSLHPHPRRWSEKVEAEGIEKRKCCTCDFAECEGVASHKKN